MVLISRFGRWALALLCFVCLMAPVVGGSALSADVTLRLHHFLSPLSVFQKGVAEPWKEAVERDSNGRIQVQIFPSMQLGGSPTQLYDQARDGVVDIIWTLPGYTAGRFPLTEVFELPFVVSNAAQTSAALQVFSEEFLREEYADVHPLFFFTHDRGSLHTRATQVKRLEDMSGLRIRAPGEIPALMLSSLGANALGMPVTQVVPSLARGVLDGALLPFQVIIPLGIEKLTPYTTQFTGERGLYTATFIVAMNKSRYEGLPDDLRSVIDRHSGFRWAVQSGLRYDEDEERARQSALDQGNTLIEIDDRGSQVWRESTQEVRQAWVEKMNSLGHNGTQMLQRAEQLIAHYQATPIDQWIP